MTKAAQLKQASPYEEPTLDDIDNLSMSFKLGQHGTDSACSVHKLSVEQSIGLCQTRAL